jgi:hypothetical protein
LGSGSIAPPFLTLALAGGQWSVWYTGHFTSRDKSPSYSLCRSLVGPKNRSGHCEEEKDLCPCQKLNPGRPVCSPSLYWLSYPNSLFASHTGWFICWRLTFLPFWHSLCMHTIIKDGCTVYMISSKSSNTSWPLMKSGMWICGITILLAHFHDMMPRHGSSVSCYLVTLPTWKHKYISRQMYHIK